VSRPLYYDGDRDEWRPVRMLPTSRRLKFEVWCVRHRLRWLADLSIRLDEWSLGR
jgi:hypothetical protein